MNWLPFALGSAFFAALTAILGKVGVSSINSNLAMFIRTIVILVMTAGILTWRHEWQDPTSLPTRAAMFLVLSGIATGLSWLCYYRALQLGPASKVAPVDKLSVALAVLLAIVFLREKPSMGSLVGAGFVVAGALILAVS